jgi:hypothetical protein
MPVPIALEELVVPEPVPVVAIVPAGIVEPEVVLPLVLASEPEVDELAEVALPEVAELVALLPELLAILPGLLVVLFDDELLMVALVPLLPLVVPLLVSVVLPELLIPVSELLLLRSL